MNIPSKTGLSTPLGTATARLEKERNQTFIHLILIFLHVSWIDVTQKVDILLRMERLQLLLTRFVRFLHLYHPIQLQHRLLDSGTTCTQEASCASIVSAVVSSDGPGHSSNCPCHLHALDVFLRNPHCRRNRQSDLILALWTE